MTSETPRRRALTYAAAAAVILTVVSGCQKIDDATGTTRSGAASVAPASAGRSSSPTSAPLPTVSDAWHKAQARIGTYRSVRVEAADKLTNPTANAVITGDLDADPVEVMFSSTDMGKCTMRRIGNALYLKGNDTYWEKSAEEGETAEDRAELADRWVKMPSAAMEKGDFDDMSVKSTFDDMRDATDPKWSTFTDAGAKLTPETVAGKKAYKLEGADHDTTIWVAADGTYDLLKIADRSPGADGLGRATFSQWNAAATVTAPADALDLTDMPLDGDEQKT